MTLLDSAGVALGLAVGVILVQFALSAAGKTKQPAPSTSSVRERGDVKTKTLEPGFELTRRLQHALTGCLFVGVSMCKILSPEQQTITLASSTAWFYLVHRLRLRYPGLNHFLKSQLTAIARPDELAGKTPGSFYFLLGSTICSLFPERVYHLSILMLSFGDPAAGLLGTLWQKRYSRADASNTKQKTLAGSMGAFCACTLVTFLYLYVVCKLESSYTKIIFVSLLSGGIGSLAERIEVAGLNDNLVIPLICACSWFLIFHNFDFMLVCYVKKQWPSTP